MGKTQPVETGDQPNLYLVENNELPFDIDTCTPLPQLARVPGRELTAAENAAINAEVDSEMFWENLPDTIERWSLTYALAMASLIPITVAVLEFHVRVLDWLN